MDGSSVAPLLTIITILVTAGLSALGVIWKQNRDQSVEIRNLAVNHAECIAKQDVILDELRRAKDELASYKVKQDVAGQKSMDKLEEIKSVVIENGKN